jgi:hypothetical protein
LDLDVTSIVTSAGGAIAELLVATTGGEVAVVVTTFVVVVVVVVRSIPSGASSKATTNTCSESEVVGAGVDAGVDAVPGPTTTTATAVFATLAVGPVVVGAIVDVSASPTCTDLAGKVVVLVVVEECRTILETVDMDVQSIVGSTGGVIVIVEVGVVKFGRSTTTTTGGSVTGTVMVAAVVVVVIVGSDPPPGAS